MANATKPSIEVVQYDAFANQYDDDITHPDEHGDAYFIGMNSEHRISGDDLTVRVHLSSKATPEIAVRQLKAIIEWIEKDAMNSTTIMEARKLADAKTHEAWLEERKRVKDGLKWQAEHPAETHAYLKDIVERARKASME